MDEAGADGEDPALLIEGDFGLVNLAALLIRADEVLEAIFLPLDRAAEQLGRVWDYQLLGIEQHDLGAKTPADIGRDHIDLLL